MVANSSGGNATSAARKPDGTLLVGGWQQDPPTGKLAGTNHPAVWQLVGGVWSNPTIYMYPPGATAASIRTLNGNGQGAGNVNASGIGAVWDDPSSPSRLDGLPNKINSAGTLLVGQRSGAPVYWWKDPATHAWHTTGVQLPTIAGSSCTAGNANGLNDANIIVGYSCNPNGANQATVWQLDFSGAAPVLVGSPLALSGLGTKSQKFANLSNATGISQSNVIGGSAHLNGQDYIVRWRLP